MTRIKQQDLFPIVLDPSKQDWIFAVYKNKRSNKIETALLGTGNEIVKMLAVVTDVRDVRWMLSQALLLDAEHDQKVGRRHDYEIE